MADDKQTIDDLVNRGLLDHWYAVAKSVQVKPGKPHGVKALGRHLVLWRDEAGRQLAESSSGPCSRPY
jgi:phenylpropionate dioxygenase-like ring-hydroxylating dioxygenase large terminal subunit